MAPKRPNSSVNIDESDDSPSKKLHVESSATTTNSAEIVQQLHQTQQNDKPIRIYCDGIFDLFHYAHMRMLEQAKNKFPNVHLIVGVCSDNVTHRLKGKTVLTDKERYESLRHCKWVDEIVEDAPWVIDQAFLDKHKIDYVAHDEIPYASDGVEDVYKFVKDQGKFLATQRTDGVSTTDLISRVLRSYDEYLIRNIKRGYSAKDLNISYFKEQEIKMRQTVSNVLEKSKQVIEQVEQKIDGIWHKKPSYHVDALVHKK